MWYEVFKFELEYIKEQNGNALTYTAITVSYKF